MAQSEYVTLSVSDGTSMKAYVSRPASTPRAGLIVFQEAFGVNAHIRDVTDRFAKEGYLCISPELFHRTAPGLEAGYDNFPAVMPHMQALTTAGLEADTKAAHGWLKSNQPKSISAVGYCMGGRTACLASMVVPLACSISYYGGGIGPSPMGPNLLDRIKEIGAPMLFFWGGLDAHIGPDAVTAVNNALRAEKKTWINAEFSFADHGFFCDARASYNAEAAKEAWALTLTFLGTHAN
ncbi:MAG TPA: dienelactone hydrolase family protein [Bryobacteraceae bacterium]|jgi:carboxymethylenebutenolidase|nr:dienelactone hydrolase family protein [Bryobacteraceae bacterium]